MPAPSFSKGYGAMIENLPHHTVDGQRRVSPSFENAATTTTGQDRPDHLAAGNLTAGKAFHRAHHLAERDVVRFDQ
jgi:hypothetical protein